MTDVKQSAPKGTQLSAQRAAGLPLWWGSATDPGPRTQNQDVTLSVQPADPRRVARGALMIVCDGVGGELGGQTAANAAANAMLDAYYADGSAPADALLSAIARANAAVKAEAEKRPEYKNMATTIVVALAKDDRLYVTNVGDSRAYLLRAGRLKQLTKDHSFIAEQIASGAMTPEEAKRSTMRTFITRSLGASANNRPNDVVVETLLPGDAVMMCSDGVHGAVPDDQIEAMLKQASSPEEAAKALVKRAVERKTTDNATAAVMMVGSAASAVGAAAAAPAKTTAALSAPAPAKK
jgi:protein phosphatase